MPVTDPPLLEAKALSAFRAALSCSPLGREPHMPQGRACAHTRDQSQWSFHNSMGTCQVSTRPCEMSRPLCTVASAAINKAPLCHWFELGGEVAQGLRLLDHSIPRQGGSIFGDRSDDLNHIVNMALGIGSPWNRQSD